VPDVVIIAAFDGAVAARVAVTRASRDNSDDAQHRTAVWVGDEGTAAYQEFAAELARRAR